MHGASAVLTHATREPCIGSPVAHTYPVDLAGGAPSAGTLDPMVDGDGPDRRDTERSARRVRRRADSLTSDEIRAGSADPHAQADAILAESDGRSESRDDPPGKPVESGQSGDNVDSPT